MIVLSAIEEMPRIAAKVCVLWGTRELDTAVNALLTDTRDDTRQGFPMEVASELLFLVQCNKARRAIDLMADTGNNYEKAFQLVDRGDQLARNGGTWDDPISSSEAAVISRRPHEAPRAATSRNGSSGNAGVFSFLGRAVMAVLGSKWFWMAVALLTAYRLFARDLGLA